MAALARMPTRPATARPDLLLRLFGRVVRRFASPAASTPRRLAAIRAMQMPDTALTRTVSGAPAPAVEVFRSGVEGRAGRIPIRGYRPPGVVDAPVVVYYHGGGWVLGNEQMNAWVCSWVADRVGAVVLSVGYRLAPEHPFPAAVDDAWDALEAIVSGGRAFGADGSRLAVMGDSAGGNLAAVVSQRAAASGQPRIAQQVLIYPVTDLRLESEPGPEFDDAPLLTRADRVAYKQSYLQGWRDLADPRLSPMCGDGVAGLAPALVLTAEHDPLRSDGRRYAERLAAEGVDVRHTDYVGMAHGFLSVPGLASGAARQALGEICQVLSSAL
jgi:acetyl esterase/lipase